MSGSAAAGRALRGLGILWMVTAAVEVVLVVLRQQVLDEMLSDALDSEAAFARLRVLSLIDLAFHLASTAGAALVAAVWLRRAERARPLALGATVALAVSWAAHLAGHVLVRLPERVELPQPIWIGVGVLYGGGLILLLMAAAARMGRSPVASPAPWIVAGLWLVAFVVARIGAAADPGSPGYGALVWAVQALHTVLPLAVAILCLVSARAPAGEKADRTDDVSRVAGAEEAARGLRQLAAATVVRFVVAMGASVAAGSALREGGGGMVFLVAIVDVMLAFWVGAALLDYRKLEPSLRGDGVVVALTALIVGVPVNLGGAWAVMRLGGMIQKMESASSFWGMPSLSDIEALQTTIQVTGIAGIALGAAGGIALTGSFRRTAASLPAPDVQPSADGLHTLVWIVSLAVAVVLLLVLFEARIPLPVLAIAALLVLVFALAAAVHVDPRDARPRPRARVPR